MEGSVESPLLQQREATEAATVERIFLKKIRIRDYRGVHTNPENALNEEFPLSLFAP
jgi:hypothetical protein